MGSSGTTIKLTSDRRGYLLDGKRTEGFAHRSDLPSTAQLKLARWAAQLAPEELSSQQRNMLAETPERKVSTRRLEAIRQDRILSSPLLRALWHGLEKEEQELILNPDRKLRVKRYPLTTGDLGAITGLSRRRVQYAAERKLPPHWTDSRGHRRFEAPGAIVAFSLTKTRQPERQYFADITAARAPLAEMRKAVGLIGLYALTNANRAELPELDATAAQLRMIADAVQVVREHPEDPLAVLGLASEPDFPGRA